MRELLERWAEMEPERCMAGPPTTNICVSVRVGDGLHDDTHAVMLDRPSAKQRALLLAAVIEAIETRGWGWELRGSGCPYFARVTSDRTHGCIADEPTDPPAFALLGAYLPALEAEEGAQ